MAKDLKNWLNNPKRDYRQGLRLLKKHSKNRALLRTLSRKTIPKKLVYELQKLQTMHDLRNGIKPAQPKKKEQKPVATEETDLQHPKRRKIIIREQEFKFDDLPANLQQRWQENAELYKHQRSLHEKLKLLEKAEPSVRKPLVQQLQKLNKTVRQNWDAIDNWDPDAEPPKSKPVDHQIDISTHHKRIQTNRSYVSRYASRVKDNPNSPYMKKVQDRINEILAVGESFDKKQTARLQKLGFSLIF